MRAVTAKGPGRTGRVNVPDARVLAMFSDGHEAETSRGEKVLRAWKELGKKG